MNTELSLDEVYVPQPREPVHGGYIRVSYPLFDTLGISLRNCDTQGMLEDNGVFADVHKKLLLPENYQIRHIFFRWPEYGVWQIGVTSPDLPPLEEGVEPPILTPLYQRCEDGTTRLLSIKIEDRWQRAYSPDELMLERL